MSNRSRGLFGGLFTAATVALSAGHALAQPANNLCANAQVITVNANATVTVNGTNVAATTDASSGVCVTSGRDVWYRFTAPAAGSITAHTCTTSPAFDTVLAVRTACPGAGSTLACDDDGCTGSAGPSTLSFPVTAGTDYWIRVAGFGNAGNTGAFTLTIIHGPPDTGPNPALGPDVIVNIVTDVRRWGTNTAGDVTAYSVGTDSCNRGDYPVMWVDNSNFTPDYNNTQHPVIGQNMYRLKSVGAYSRFEQLGQSWLKHGFVSTNSGGCGGCAPNSTRTWRPSLQGFQTFGGDVLGINCSDTYGAGLNGDQSTQGAKNIVHPTLGTSPFVRNNGTGDATIRQRLQVPTSDVTGQPAGTRFFVDGQYVTADDAQFVRPGEAVAFNALNNASWREVSAATLGNLNPSTVGGTIQMQPGIFAWRAADAGVTLVSADHDDMPNPCTGYRAPDGGPQYPAGTKFVRSRFWVAAKVTDLGGGLFRYEFAVYNQTSDRSAGVFSLAFPDAAETPSSFTFHAPPYHSGEPWSNAAWTMTKENGALTFATQSFATNANANAIRWGTLYNFGFTTTVAPVSGSAAIGLFKPGADASAPASVTVPNIPVPSVPSCPSDFNGDGFRDPDDLADFITCFFLNTATPGTCPAADFNGDGNVDPDDLADFITVFFTVLC